MGLLDIFGKKGVGEIVEKTPYSIKATFQPIRLSIKEGGPVELCLKIKNIQKEALMTSVVVKAPGAIGLDSVGLNNLREIRLGYLKPGEERALSIQLYPITRSVPGTHDIEVTALAHYRDYAHVLNAVKKALALRVID